jgi:hypothetical protein
MNEEFSTGVKILLQRMETNPEEFYKRVIPEEYETLKDVKWHDIIHSVVTSKHEGKKFSCSLFLTDTEVDALFEGYAKIRRKEFDNNVMRQLLVTEDKNEGVKLSSAMRQQRVGAANNNINQQYDMATNRYQNVANSAAQAQGLMQAYPYTPYTPEEWHPEPAPKSILDQIQRRLGIK